MADCEFIKRCPFFWDKMKNAPAMSSIYKKKYCKGDNSNCARYMVATRAGRDKVPKDLFPNQQERAKKIISKG